MNIQQLIISEVANTETVMDYIEDLYPTLPYNISNVFAEADLLSHLSSDSAKYKHVWIKAKVIRYFILSAGEYPDPCSR